MNLRPLKSLFYYLQYNSYFQEDLVEKYDSKGRLIEMGFCVRFQLSSLMLLFPTLEGSDAIVFCLLKAYSRLGILVP